MGRAAADGALALCATYFAPIRRGFQGKSNTLFLGWLGNKMRGLLAVTELLVENETNRTKGFVADVARIRVGFAYVRTAVGALA